MRGSGANTPKIAKFRSAEVSAAYVLACERVDANPKLVLSLSNYYYLPHSIVTPQVKLSLNGLQMLLNYEVVPPSEAKNLLRILAIQVRLSVFVSLCLCSVSLCLCLSPSLYLSLLISPMDWPSPGSIWQH
jgi:hypothetical protein